MRTRYFITCVAIVAVLLLTPYAQAGGIGLSAYYFDSYRIGFRAELNSTLVLRPTVGLISSQTEIEDRFGPDRTSKSKLYSLAVDLLFTSAHDHTLHPFELYIGGGPELRYQEFDSGGAFGSDIMRHLSLHGLAGGAYWISERFSFFGEVGISIGDDPSFDGSNYTLRSLSRLGVNFLF